MPRFSVIVPHYDRSVSDEFLLRGIDNLGRQTFRDFEVLIYHDGPTSRPIPDQELLRRCPQIERIIVTGRRANDFGHSLRDRGIREAHGDYIVHLNADNLLYTFALQEIADELDFDRGRTAEPGIHVIYEDNNHIIIFPIVMRGMYTNGRTVWRDRNWHRRPNAERRATILTGLPPRIYYIDCMQLVMRRAIWLEEGGWHDKSERSDGLMYQELVRKYGARYVAKVLGEHW